MPPTPPQCVLSSPNLYPPPRAVHPHLLPAHARAWLVTAEMGGPSTPSMRTRPRADPPWGAHGGLRGISPSSGNARFGVPALSTALGGGGAARCPPAGCGGPREGGSGAATGLSPVPAPRSPPPRRRMLFSTPVTGAAGCSPSVTSWMRAPSSTPPEPSAKQVRGAGGRAAPAPQTPSRGDLHIPPGAARHPTASGASRPAQPRSREARPRCRWGGGRGSRGLSTP